MSDAMTDAIGQTDSLSEGEYLDDKQAPEAISGNLSEGNAEERLAAMAKKLATMDQMLRRLITRDAARRIKTLALQTAFVRKLGLKAVPLNDPAASVFPIEVLKHDRPVARVLAFGSMGDNLGMTSREFFKVIDGLPIEVIFLKDFEQCWYLKGLLGLSFDVSSTADLLKEMTGEYKLPTLAVGASSGAFAAILFGTLLGIERVLAFSPQTEVSRRVVSRFQSVDSETREIDLLSKFGDLATVLQTHPQLPLIRIYYGQRAGFDREQAERLKGFSSVHLRPLPWDGHNTATWLKGRSELDGVLRSALSFNDEWL